MLPPTITNDPLVVRARELLASLELEQRNHALQEAIHLAERKPYLHTVQDSKLVRLSYEQAISAATVDAESLGSLYLHIPFCTKRCTYCHYYKVTDASAGLMDEFADVLMAEFDLIRERLAIDHVRPRTIHFGGGTPSLLSEDQWLRLLTLLGERIDLAAVEEVAIECSPEDVTPEKLRTWRDSGVNRLSLGVQSFSEPILRHLERVHTPEQSVACIEQAQAAGFENINVDLMHAMPASSFPLWLHDVRTAQRLAPESVTIYATRPDPKDGEAAGRRGFPGLDDRVLGHALAHEAFMPSGYYQFSPNQYIRSPKGRCLAKQQRNRCRDVLGLGPSAHSIFRGAFFYNRGGLDTYLDRIRAGTPCIVKGAALSEDEERVRFLQFGLKLSGLGKEDEENGALCDEYQQRFARSLREDFRTKLDFLAAQGLGDDDEVSAKLSLAGMLLVREVVQFMAEPDMNLGVED